MSWNFWKPKPARVVVSANEIGTAITGALHGMLTCTPRLADDFYTLTTQDEVKRIACKAWEPWVAQTDDCDDQAFAVKHYANREAYDLGLKHPLALGFMWSAGDKAHAYTLAVCTDAHALLAVHVYNQTSGFWEAVSTLDKPITLIVV